MEGNDEVEDDEEDDGYDYGQEETESRIKRRYDNGIQRGRGDTYYYKRAFVLQLTKIHRNPERCGECT